MNRLITATAAAALIFGSVQSLDECSTCAAADESPSPSLITNPHVTVIALETLDQAQVFGYLRVNQQCFRVLFDTGSNSIWVPHKICEHCAGTERLQASEDIGGQIFERLYGSGRVAGHTVQASLALGHGVVLGYAVIGSVTKQDGDIKSFDSEGVVGLSFLALEEPGHQTNLLSSLSAMKRFRDQSLAFSFAFHPPAASTPSHLLFGAVHQLLPPDTYSSPIFFPVAASTAWGSHGFWSLELNGVAVDGQPIMTLPVAAVIDTGSSLLLLPRPAFDLLMRHLQIALQERVHRTSRDSVRCHRCSHADFPPLSFAFAGANARVFALHGRDYVRCEHGACEPQLGVIDIDPDSESVVVLGLIFLRAFPTVFDFTQRRVGVSCTGHCLNGGPSEPLAPVRRLDQVTSRASVQHLLSLVAILLVITGCSLWLRAHAVAWLGS